VRLAATAGYLAFLVGPPMPVDRQEIMDLITLITRK